MAVLGRATLLLALAVSAYGIGAALYGVRRNRPEWADSAAARSTRSPSILTVAFVVLEAAFLRNDFSFNTVAQTSSSTTPTFYRGAAVWSSQQGSLLLWAWLESLWSSLILFMTRKRLRDITPYATAILLGFCTFFVSLMVFYATPFGTTTPAPADGAGLDPLLRHPSMMIHPPMLYSGYTLSIIPLAFAMAALIARRIDADWLRATRRFALAAWLFLGVGILLGARWSYAELGWGGYWEWDPVENARAAAVAHADGVPALGDDPGEARDAEGVERLADARERDPGGDGHLQHLVQRLDPLDGRRHQLGRGDLAGADQPGLGGGVEQREFAGHRLDLLAEMGDLDVAEALDAGCGQSRCGDGVPERVARGELLVDGLPWAGVEYRQPVVLGRCRGARRGCRSRTAPAAGDRPAGARRGRRRSAARRGTAARSWPGLQHDVERRRLLGDAPHPGNSQPRRTTCRSRASPAIAPSAAAPGWASDDGVHTSVEMA